MGGEILWDRYGVAHIYGLDEPSAIHGFGWAGHFTDILTRESPLNAADHSVQFVDYDADGGLDLSVTDGYGPIGGHFLFRNTLSEEAKRRSLSVLALDSEGHHTRFGAEVRL